MRVGKEKREEMKEKERKLGKERKREKRVTKNNKKYKIGLVRSKTSEI